MQDLLKTRYAGVLDNNILSEIEIVAKFRSFERAEVILEIGQSIHFIPLVLSGAVKVMREDVDRGELLLYYLRGGDTCTMTGTCCRPNRISAMRVIEAARVDVAAVPRNKLRIA